jgi:lipoprotein signal peptidase
MAPSRAAVGVGLLTVLLALASDLATKYWARLALSSDAVVPLVPDFLWGWLTFNPNGVYGVLAGMPGPWKSAILLGVTGLALLWLSTQLFQPSRATRQGAALILGGGLGNFGERLFAAEGVTDFLQLGLGAPWAVAGTFNLADVWICCGALVLLAGQWPGFSRERN